MLLEDGLGDGKAQTGALLAGIRTGAVVPIKDIGQVVGRDAGAVVLHLYPHALGAALGPQDEDAVFADVVHGVAQQVMQCALHHVGVCVNGQFLVRQLQLELPDEELPVYADPNMMQRALHNLLGNAMHHIGKDGIFILRAQRCTEGVRVEVEDHGPGISADDLPYIFDRYYRSRSDAGKQGTGLGLSITKAIFQQHGFRFGVQSAIGMGTTFWFIMNDLPANAAEMAGQE